MINSATARPAVCQIVHTLNVGGAEILARQFAEQSADEYRGMFVCLDSAGVMAEELRARGFAVEVLERRPGFDWGCLRRLASVFRRHQVRVVHAHQYAPFFYAALARLLVPGRLPIIFTEHGRDYPDYRRIKRVVANQFLLRRVDHVVGVGQCVRAALVDFEGLPPGRIEVVYNGIDVGAYAPSAARRAAMRQQLGLGAHELAIIHVARLNTLKDHVTALRAFARVGREMPAARLLVAGDGEQRPQIEALIDELGIRPQVYMLGTRRDVADLLKAADVFLLSSISEGIPLTLIEAMAAGLPCVSTDVGGVGEVVINGLTGLLSPARDFENLAGQLRRVLLDAGLRRSLGEAGRDRAGRLFDAATMHNAYRSMYRQLSARQGAPRREQQEVVAV